ncbi:NADH-quinone oxidoreductase subunit NuoE [Buchnera aphidicola]|uniref:NADH-quinone oxidoreductase subunit NuoE n=1 Tax=Buchnera aphidicola TaxID=9 RepID=UPI0034648347
MLKKNKLTAIELYRIKKEKKYYENTQAVCIEALKIVQSSRGWISDDIIKDIAKVLCVSESTLEEVATFYSQIYRRPVGKYVIRYCDSVVCYMMGSNQIEYFLKCFLRINLGQTTIDNKFTLLPISCLGNCDKAPVMMINDVTYSNININDIKTLLENINEKS